MEEKLCLASIFWFEFGPLFTFSLLQAAGAPVVSYFAALISF